MDKKSKTTTVFAVGELVTIVCPGWAWDGKTGKVLEVIPANSGSLRHETGYTVLIEWPEKDDLPRRYHFWQSQVRPHAPAPSKLVKSGQLREKASAQPTISTKFAVGQRVRVIANLGGLYAAQIGVIGVISKQRKERSEGYPRYDVTYMKPFSRPNEKGREKIVIVREDDLESASEAETEIVKPSQARFAVGQRVRVIANAGGLAAQIGVVGVIQRAHRKRHGYRYYDVRCHDAQGHEQIAMILEDDLETVSEEAEATPAIEPVEPQTAARTRAFAIGDQVIVDDYLKGADAANASDASDASPMRWNDVGVIQAHAKSLSQGYVYTVRFPHRVEHIHEDHLRVAPHASAPHASAPEPAKPAKSLEQPPKFPPGEHVYVDPRSEFAYAAYTRKGAIGVIVGVGQPVRGIRRYDVRYAGTREAKQAAERDPLHALPVAQIREEHLVSDEGRVRHACEYRAEKRLRPGERLWCDKGGCFEDDCVVCQQAPEWRERHGLALSMPPQPIMPTPTPARQPEMPYSTAALAALAAALATGDAYEFALALVRDKLERGLGRDAILVWQTERQWIHIVDGGTCYDVARGGFYLTMLKGQKCSIRYALKTLVADAERRIAGVPHQVGLWGCEAQA